MVFSTGDLHLNENGVCTAGLMSLRAGDDFESVMHCVYDNGQIRLYYPYINEHNLT